MIIEFIPSIKTATQKTLKDSVVVVFDVLRATTSIMAALQAGCKQVVPCATIDEARQKAKTLNEKGERVWLAGERGGVMIPGFDSNNSPVELIRSGGYVVILTTSNGTKALHKAMAGRMVLVACLNNLKATAENLLEIQPKRIVLLAAGEYGKKSPEDSLAAGLLIKELLQLSRKQWRSLPQLSPKAKAAYKKYQAVTKPKLLSLIKTFPHAKELIKYGFTEDVQFASKINNNEMVGKMDKGMIQGIMP